MANKLSDITGKRYRVPTNQELGSAMNLCGGKTSGTWYEWTDTEYNSVPGEYILRSHLGSMIHLDPKLRSSVYAVRLVEDIG